MKKTLLIFFVALSVSLSLVSCHSKEERIYIDEELEKAKNYSTAECINYLYEGCVWKKDYNALSRILKASPSSLERIRKGETMPTQSFESEVQLMTYEYIQCGCSIYELRSAHNDLKWFEAKWLRIFRVFNIIIILIFVSGIFDGDNGCLFAFVIVYVVFLLIVMGLRVMPQSVNDEFKNGIDRTVEFVVDQ